MDKSKIILINKPSGPTSYKLIRTVAREYGFKKIGHAGTLDPLATGLMIAMSENATKLSDELMKKDKVYYVEMKLGFMTDTLDLEGEVVDKKEVVDINIDKINKVLKTFIGEIEQIPPKYSAIKVNGQKLYELARKNIEVDIPKRLVKIYDIYDISYKDYTISFRANVSSGTYIRSLVRDIAYKLDTCGTMSYLKRESIDRFKNPEDIEILNVYDVIKLDNYEVNDEEYFKIKNGQTVEIENTIFITKKLHIFKNGEYKGICDILSKTKKGVIIKRTSFFE